MNKKRESSEIVTERIIKVATELFSEYGINGVGIRRIAAEAGISHTLLIRYIGSKEALITEILQRRIRELTSPRPGKNGQDSVRTLAGLRNTLLNSLNDDKDIMKLIMRSELDGLSPASYVAGNSERAANLIAKWIESQRTDNNLPDAKLVSAIIIGAMFSLVSITPWLMTAVGLPQEDFEKRKEDIVDTLIWIIAKAIGLTPDSPA